MSNFIEVFVIKISDGMSINREVNTNMLIDVYDIKGVVENVIKINDFGQRLFYSCRENYFEIKEKIKETEDE